MPINTSNTGSASFIHWDKVGIAAGTLTVPPPIRLSVEGELAAPPAAASESRRHPAPVLQAHFESPSVLAVSSSFLLSA